jgi:hypothetical protein
VSNLQTVILTLSVAYAVIGALLLVVLVYARLHWSLKAVAVVVTSAFYVVSFTEMRGLGEHRAAACYLQAAPGPHRRAAFA